MHANLCMHTFITFFVCIQSVGFFKKVPFFRKNCAFSPIWYGVKVSISNLVRCKDSELAYEHAWTAMKCFWRGNHCLYWSPSEKRFMDIIIKKNHLLRTCSVFFVFYSNNGRFPFDQNFRNFRSETEWNGKNSGKSFRKFRNTFECTLFEGISGIIENFVFHSEEMSGLVSLPSVNWRGHLKFPPHKAGNCSHKHYVVVSIENGTTYCFTVMLL